MNKRSAAVWRQVKAWWWVVAIVAGAYLWQTRNLLDSGQSVTPQRLPSLTGGSHRLLDEQRPTLVYFFAPWCSVCQLSFDNLSTIDNTKLHISAVALDYASEQAVADFIAVHGEGQRALLGHDSLKQQFGVRGYPTYYIVSPSGEILMSDMGYSTALGLKVRQWLAQGP